MAAVVTVAVGMGVVAAVWIGARAGAQSAPGGTTEGAGRELYLTGCSSCHGPDGRGTDRGPTLVGVGAAAADFYLSTGRMPLDEPRNQAVRKPPAYGRAEIDQLVAYVASLGPGPEIPKVHPEEGDLPTGYELYANNCAPCHSSAGAGGAVGRGIIAPNLQRSKPTQVAEAIRIGPGVMPVFGPEALDDHQVASVVRYVEYLQDPEDQGGLGLGHLGPLPEGFVAWLVGLGLMLVVIRWMGTTD
jgi:ubiquinol-cytochrome c reductase cytochrome c subunit